MRQRKRQRAKVGLLAALAFAMTGSVPANAQTGEPLHDDVETLAADDMLGRVTGSNSDAATYIEDQLSGYPNITVRTQPFVNIEGTSATNVLAWIPGSDPQVANEFVLIGAHYDHVATCDPKGDGDDRICNGATDNATGVAITLDIARKLALGPQPRRTVAFAFWDSEEVDLGGSMAYRLAMQALPEKPIAYINYDIQGANLLPSLMHDTFAIGASTGGARLVGAVRQASGSAGYPLNVRELPEAMGLYQSDYAMFLRPDLAYDAIHRAFRGAAPPQDVTRNLRVLPKVPTVFFTDSSGPCYHTTQDEGEAGSNVVDYDKLRSQANIGLALARDLATGAKPQPNVPALPIPAVADVQQLIDIGVIALGDEWFVDNTGDADRQGLESAIAELRSVIADRWINPLTELEVLVSSASFAINMLNAGPCEGFQ